MNRIALRGSMTHRGLIGAVLYAKDLRRIAQFYASVMNVEVQTIEEGFAILGAATSRLVIVRTPRRIANTIDIAVPPEPRAQTLAFAVDDIAYARGRAAKLDGAVHGVETEWQFEGARVCDGYDPEGNIFQVRQKD